MPAVILIIVLAALIKRVNVFEAFLEGARQGMGTVVSVFPTFCALFFLIGVFEASGGESVASYALRPLAFALRLPDAIAPLMILRPLSGSGATAFFKTLISRVGANSFAGRTAAVMLGSSETTMYTISVYFGAAKVKKTRYAIPCALIGDVTAFVASAALVTLFF